MKKLLKLMVVAALLCGGWSCNTPLDDVEKEPEIEVTLYNISGSWKLGEWSGHTLQDDNFVYIDFVRSDRTYTMYQNVDSFGTRVITGRFNLYLDETIGKQVLRGDYANGVGDWNHRYIVDRLTASTMVLVALDDSSDICTYHREEIPAEIRGE